VFTAAAGELPGVAYILTTPGALAANLGLGLVCSLAAQWLYTAALKTIPASRASIAATFEPVVAALFGLVLFGQKMDAFGVAGIVCEIAALVILQLPAPAKRKG
jgi:DME family drug/metabolite transporter